MVGVDPTLLLPGVIWPGWPIPWLRSIAHLDTDIMLESIAKDLSLIRLRNNLARFAPELLARYGMNSTQALEHVSEIMEAEAEADSIQ